jgi:hypothetical protein
MRSEAVVESVRVVVLPAVELGTVDFTAYNEIVSIQKWWISVQAKAAAISQPQA